MNTRVLVGLLVAALSVLSGCTAGRFARLSPGMTSEAVVEVMGPPSKVVEWNDRESTWYFGHAHCTLMRDGQVVTKDAARTEFIANTPMGQVRTERQPSCTPEGVSVDAKRTVSVGAGWGGFVTK